MRLPILITALHIRQEQVDATRKCFLSLESKEHMLDITIDSSNESISLSTKWNRFIRQWVYKDYQYLIIIANDTYAKPESIDYMVRFMEDNPNVMIGESLLNRGKQEFDDVQLGYSSEYTLSISDTSNFIIRKEVINKVGLFNEQRYPFAQNERDYIYRCKLADMKVATMNMRLFYHPMISLTLDNRGDFSEDVKRYKEEWGGDWLDEKFTHPFNDSNLSYFYIT